MTNPTDELLAERAKTHGSYTVHARTTQRLKKIIRAELNYEKLNDCQQEAIDMICHKIGRIIAGNPDYADHWDDIAGYARLVAKECKP